MGSIKIHAYACCRSHNTRLNHTVGYEHAEIDGSSLAMWCLSHLSFPQITSKILICTCDMLWKQPKKLSYKLKALFHQYMLERTWLNEKLFLTLVQNHTQWVKNSLGYEILVLLSQNLLSKKHIKNTLKYIKQEYYGTELFCHLRCSRDVSSGFNCKLL
jgi:hypothetical protein